MYACTGGCDEVAEYLISKGAVATSENKVCQSTEKLELVLTAV